MIYALQKLRDRRQALEVEIALLQGEAKPVRQKLADIDRQIGRARQELSDIEAQTKKLDVKPAVTDHAVVRYLERLYGFDFENIRNEILSDKMLGAMNFGASGLKVDGGRFVLDGKKVITFITKD